MRRFVIIPLVLLSALLYACGGGEPPPVQPGSSVQPEVPLATTQPKPAETMPQVALETPLAQSESIHEPIVETPQLTGTPLSQANETVAAETAIEPIEVTYFTPSQGEGPYYPVEKLVDRDNDLTIVTGNREMAAGQVIAFGGRVYDASGMPAPGLVVEIWQTDDSGIYLHPGDPDTSQRDPNFQFYGESTTTADGSYSFRTIVPGRYEPRPRHIHVKVKYDGQELLTTQFYFEGDPELANEGMFNQAGGAGIHLIIALAEDQDSAGNPVLFGQRDIVLNVEMPG